MLQVNQILEALKKYDIATYQHCVRVSQLCRFLADAAQLPEEDQLKAQFSGLLHDVGKMKIPQNVLNKPGKLTDDEYDLMKRHAIFSAELIAPLEESQFFREVRLNVLHHHERVDGQGYPFELDGEQVPYISRLILIVDTVDAMTQTRAYRKGLPMHVVYKELDKFSGSQFDGELVEVFTKAYQKLLEDQKRSRIISLPTKSKQAA